MDSIGIHVPFFQEEAGVLLKSGGIGQSAFSPNGALYAEAFFFQGQVMDFDRCTGQFSNARVIDFEATGDPNTTESDWAGVAFSPDSRFLYVSRWDTLYQYDMSVKDFNSTRQTIAQYDGMPDSLGLKGSGFYTLLTGPDGKIYINTPGSTRALHVIHRPNERGLACNFQKWGLGLPTLHYGQLPNMPNFNLGTLEPPCVYCDTLTHAAAFTLFPNPASEEVIVCNKSMATDVPLRFRLFDALGRLMLEETMEKLPHRIAVGHLPEAGYFYRVYSQDGKRLSSGTLLKVQ